MSFARLAAGQGVSVLMACTGVFTQLLAHNVGFSSPAFQNWLVYCCIMWVFGLRWTRGSSDPPATAATQASVEQPQVLAGYLGGLRVPVQYYALVSVADVAANMLVVAAYRNTTIASVSLLDAATIPTCMMLSMRFLGVKYTRQHFIGVGVCLCGLVLVVVSDLWLHHEEPTEGRNPVIGDLFAVASAVCYGVANVSQEALIKHNDNTEFLFMLGFFGTIFSGLVVVCTELPILATFDWQSSGPMLLFGYTICMVSIYSSISKFLQLYDATSLNLSLLSSDIWSVVAAVFVFGASLNMIYFAALVVIIAGVVLYNTESVSDGQHSGIAMEPPNENESSV
mmetsp:Transcript_11789/g.21854  ORF Transcript_11789/g.21854 Transcript_11789/m.21854 type:complete len:339 (+) Transcript_11789:62-1078(+)